MSPVFPNVKWLALWFRTLGCYIYQNDLLYLLFFDKENNIYSNTNHRYWKLFALENSELLESTLEINSDGALSNNGSYNGSPP